jgi:hypothetical protein
VATVQCPSCGATNPNGRRRLSRCRRCHEPLGKCRYCEHYDQRLLDCTNPGHREDERIVDADAVLNCPGFASTLAGPRLGRRAPWAVLRTAVLTTAAVSLLLFGLVRFYGGPGEAPPPVTLKTTAIAPLISFLDDGFDLSVLVQNEADHPARDVHITVLGSSMRHLTCQYMDPPECYAEGPARSACAQLGDIESGGTRSVLFHFTAAQAGELDLTAQVTAANLEGVERLPIEGEVVP